jgi:signal transduction histidine kinase
LFTALLGAFLLLVTGHASRVEEQKRAMEMHCAKCQIHVLNDQLERRVTERTGQLDRTNQNLRQEIASRHQVETELRRAGDRLHALSGRLVTIQEAERRHLARELHDEFGQALTATKINLQALQRFPDPDALAPRLQDSISLVDHLLQQARALSLNLRPPMLDDLGLTAALRWYVDQQAQRAGLREHFVADSLEQRLEPGLETACFRVAQEAITNVVRHARAQQVSVELRCEAGELHLLVCDDGVGFEPAGVKAAAERGGSLGVAGMEERVSLMGGRFVCKSAPQQGTEIHAYFPLKFLNGSPETETLSA